MTQISSSIKISHRVDIIRVFQASETTDSDLGSSGCSVSVVLGIWQVGIGHLWLDNGGLHGVALHVVHGKVGGGDTESHGVGDVVDRLDNAVGVDVAVAAPCDTVSSLHLLLDRVGVAVAVVVLTEIVLSVVLGVGCVNRDCTCSSNHRSRGNYRSGNWGSNRGGNWGRSNSWGGVAIVGGIGQVGIADF